MALPTGAGLFHTCPGITYADLAIDGHCEPRPACSSGFLGIPVMAL
jgi:hypothetical protein